MLGNVALTLLTVLLLQLMLAVAWRVSSRLLGLSRRASRHWIISTLLCALSVALVLARGWVPDVFADEPTASLDPVRTRAVTDLMIEDAKRRNTALVVVTHDHALLPSFDATRRMDDFTGR